MRESHTDTEKGIETDTQRETDSKKETGEGEKERVCV